MKDDIESYVIHGGKVLVYGDLHLSSTYEGQHINYLEECYSNMEKIVSETKKVKASAVIFLGDLIGVKERNIHDRRMLKEVLSFFITLNGLTNRNVYSVRGNHDTGDYPDFDLLLGLGLLKNPTYIDYEGDSGVEVRFHIVNYGYEKKLIHLNDSCSNVILCHNDIQIPGVTTWYKTKEGIILANQNNWAGADMVLAGHIHNPSTQTVQIGVGEEKTPISLFYPGSPSRTAERFDDCFYIMFEYNKSINTTEFDAKLFGLKKASEVFYPKEKFITDDEKSDEVRQSESLKSIVSEIMGSRVMSGDLFHQIEIMPGASERARNIACEYLQRAIDSMPK